MRGVMELGRERGERERKRDRREGEREEGGREGGGWREREKKIM